MDCGLHQTFLHQGYTIDHIPHTLYSCSNVRIIFRWLCQHQQRQLSAFYIFPNTSPAAVAHLTLSCDSLQYFWTDRKRRNPNTKNKIKWEWWRSSERVNGTDTGTVKLPIISYNLISNVKILPQLVLFEFSFWHSGCRAENTFFYIIFFFYFLVFFNRNIPRSLKIE